MNGWARSAGLRGLIGALAATLFAVAWLAGWVWRSGRSTGPAARDVEQSSGELVYSLAVLPPAAARSGMRLVPSPDEPHALMFVHPDSPCWFEVPRPEAFAEYAARITGPDRVRRSGGSSDASQPASDGRPGEEGANWGFVGAEACADCHRERYDSYARTAHFLTSAPADASTVLGPTHGPDSVLRSAHPDLQFRMLSEPNGRIVQEVSFRQLRKRVPMDIVTGAGVVGQTYLFWQGAALYQDHVSFYTRNGSWINSPGYQDGTAWYARKVIPKCLECHATYVETVGHDLPVYDPTTLILGISCERCHGPGADHVSYHRSHADGAAKYIVNPSDLSADQQNSICAQCHFGSATPKRPPFSFRPGDAVEDFWQLPPGAESMAGGVHSSNQLARLRLSACFTGSPAMTCSECHDPHVNQRGDIRWFSQRCQGCHAVEHCGLFERLGPTISANCIDCHMPQREDDKIVVHNRSGTEFPLLRDHFIRILPDRKEAAAP